MPAYSQQYEAHPALTANTPALGRGLDTKCATSPHAKTPGWLRLSSVGWGKWEGRRGKGKEGRRDKGENIRVGSRRGVEGE